MMGMGDPKGFHEGSQDETYKKREKNFYNNLEKIRKGGLTCTDYEISSTSARLFPKKGVVSANYMKSSFIKLMLRNLKNPLLTSGGVRMLDLDLKSCYVTLLLAFFPFISGKLREIIESHGI